MIIWQLLSTRVNQQFILLVNIPIVIIHQVCMGHISVASEKLEESLTIILIHLIISISLLDLKPRHFIEQNILGIFTHCPLKICSESIKTCSFEKCWLLANDRKSDFIRLSFKMSFDDVEFRGFCQKLPKVELHAHLNGSLSNNTLKELAEDRMKYLGIDKWKICFKWIFHPGFFIQV